MAKKKQQRICDICGGSGQVSFFQGVSRFLLTSEECDACAGTGHVLAYATDIKKKNKSSRTKKKGSK